MYMRGPKPSSIARQEGFAAIVIAIVLILVLGVTTVGFASLMRKEQRSALDKHLSSQAYYAAESGINDAAKAINAGYASTKSTCAPLPAATTGPGVDFLKSNSVGTTDSGSSYTCLTIDPAPKSVEYQSVDTVQSKIIKMTGVNPADETSTELIKDIVISWQDADGSTSFAPAGHTFPKATDWSYPSVLRVSITPLASSFIKRATLISGTYIAFLYPNGSGAAGSAPVYSYADAVGSDAGKIIDGNCNTGNIPRHCHVKITDLGQANYLLSLRAIYNKAARVTIQAYGYDGSQLRIRNAQTVVDSTGKAQDVLRRIQVRIPSKNTYTHTDSALETTGSICKQLNIVPEDGSNACSP